MDRGPANQGSTHVFASVGPRPDARTTQAVMAARPRQWAVLARNSDERSWRVFAGTSGSETDTRRTWAWVAPMKVVQQGQLYVALVGPAPEPPVETSTCLDNEPALPVTTGTQLVLVASLAPECATCGGPIEHRPGRPGRPRRHCEVCRPPTWPRRGEIWEVDGREYVVLGSITRPNRSVRARPVDSALARWMDVGAEWINARRIHPTVPARSAS